MLGSRHDHGVGWEVGLAILIDHGHKGDHLHRALRIALHQTASTSIYHLHAPWSMWTVSLITLQERCYTPGNSFAYPPCIRKHEEAAEYRA